jgi:hypothetical protein
LLCETSKGHQQEQTAAEKTEPGKVPPKWLKYVKEEKIKFEREG